jgi:hypothetical protein
MELLIIQLSPAYYLSPLGSKCFPWHHFLKTPSVASSINKQNYTTMFNTWQRITANSSWPSQFLVSRHRNSFKVTSIEVLKSPSKHFQASCTIGHTITLRTHSEFFVMKIISYKTNFSNSHTKCNMFMYNIRTLPFYIFTHSNIM